MVGQNKGFAAAFHVKLYEWVELLGLPKFPVHKRFTIFLPILLYSHYLANPSYDYTGTTL